MTFTGAGRHQQTQKTVPKSIYLFKSIPSLLFICKTVQMYIKGNLLCLWMYELGFWMECCLNLGQNKVIKENTFCVCELFLCALFLLNRLMFYCKSKFGNAQAGLCTKAKSYHSKDTRRFSEIHQSQPLVHKPTHTHIFHTICRLSAQVHEL